MIENPSVSPEKRVFLVLCYASFGLVGFILSMRTNIFQYVQSAYLEGYDHIATLVLVSGILMQIPLYLTGLYIEREGFQKALLLGMVSFSVPVFLLGFVRSVFHFDLIFSLFMLGYAVAIMALNLFTSNLYPERKGNVLLMLHLFFAIGALSGPMWISFFKDAGYSWQRGITLASLPLFVILVLIIRANRNISFKTAPRETVNLKTTEKKNYTSPFLWLFIVIFLCSQTWEYGMATWFVIYANDTAGMDPSKAAWYMSLFYGSYPLVRIVFSRFIHRLNLLTVLFFAFSLSAVFILLGIISGNFLYFSLTGLGVALLYPAIIAAMQDHFGDSATRTIGFITMTGGLIQYLAIWFVGIISNRLGIEKGFSSMIWYMVAGALAVTAVYTLKKRQIPDRRFTPAG